MATRIADVYKVSMPGALVQLLAIFEVGIVLRLVWSVTVEAICRFEACLEPLIPLGQRQ